MAVTEEQIRDRISPLKEISNPTLLAALEDVMPACHNLEIHDIFGKLTWHIGGSAGDGWFREEPVVRGQGIAIITRLVNAAWSHAAACGDDGKTRKEYRLEVDRAWAALPTCPECGEKVTPAEAAVSSVAWAHRDCA